MLWCGVALRCDILRCVQLDIKANLHLQHQINKMSVHNIAIAMTPSLLRPEVETIETLVAYGQLSQQLVATLIEEFTALFTVCHRLTRLYPSVVTDRRCDRLCSLLLQDTAKS